MKCLSQYIRMMSLKMRWVWIWATFGIQMLQSYTSTWTPNVHLAMHQMISTLLTVLGTARSTQRFIPVQPTIAIYCLTSLVCHTLLQQPWLLHDVKVCDQGSTPFTALHVTRTYQQNGVALRIRPKDRPYEILSTCNQRASRPNLHHINSGEIK